MLNYIATYENVQIVFLLVCAVCFVGALINRRISKAQSWEHEEKQEQRRERFMAINAPKSTAIVEHD